MLRNLIPLLCVPVYLAISLLLRLDGLLVAHRVRLRVIELRIHHMLVAQELVVRIVDVVVPLLNLRLYLRGLTACEVVIVRVLGRADRAHRL